MSPWLQRTGSYFKHHISSLRVVAGPQALSKIRMLTQHIRAAAFIICFLYRFFEGLDLEFSDCFTLALTHERPDKSGECEAYDPVYRQATEQLL